MNEFLIPGYETTYQYFYKPYWTSEPEDKWLKKNIVNLADLEKGRHIDRCKCQEVKAVQDSFVCDIKSWDYLGKSKSEYSDKYGQVWAEFQLKKNIPTRSKPGMRAELKGIMPADPATYIYNIPGYNEPQRGCWWNEKLKFNDDLQCRLSRQYQKRQRYLTEKVHLHQPLSTNTT